MTHKINKIEKDLNALLEAMIAGQVAELEGSSALRDITWRLAHDKNRSAISRWHWKNIAGLFARKYRIQLACAAEV